MATILMIFVVLSEFLVAWSLNNSDVIGLYTVDTTPAQNKEYNILNDIEFIKLINTITLIYRGKLDGGLRYDDLNGTEYLVKPKSHRERENELREQLNDKNHTGPICTDRICYDRETAEQYLDELERKSSMWLLAVQEVPFIIMVTLLGAVAITGISGNILILIGVLKSSKLRNSTSVLLCSLALSDVLVLGVCLPLQVIKRFFSVYAFTTLGVCRLFELLKNFSIVISTLTMTAMGVERYIAICQPLKARSYCTVANARKVVVAIWILSFSVSLPTVFLIFQHQGYAFCALKFPSMAIRGLYYFGILALVFAIPMLVMCPLYVKIFRELRRSSQDMSRLQSEDNGTKESNKQAREAVKTRHQVVKMLVTVLAVFILSWGPPTTYDATEMVHRIKYGKSLQRSGTLSFILDTIGFCNSLFNPLIYIIMSRQFRAYIRNSLPCKTANKSARILSATEKSVSQTQTSNVE